MWIFDEILETHPQKPTLLPNILHPCWTQQETVLMTVEESSSGGLKGHIKKSRQVSNVRFPQTKRDIMDKVGERERE